MICTWYYQLRRTISKYHSWYLCQISLQIMLLPMQIAYHYAFDTAIGKHPSLRRGRLDQVRSCITMLTTSRAFFIASILRTIRPGLFSKTGNTLESSVEVVKPPLEDMGDGKTKTATFAMSWFWFPEAQFGCAHGVVRTKVGYTGGSKPFPTYTSL